MARDTGSSTRRQWLSGSTSLALVGAAPPPKPDVIVSSRAIHQEIDFRVKPERVYDALVHSKEFTAFSSGRVAEMQHQVGGAFSLFSGHIVGRFLELIPHRRIVQAWRAGDWHEGVYSIVRFEVRHQGNGSRLILDHTGFPADLAEHLVSYWQENYWSAMRRYFG